MGHEHENAVRQIMQLFFPNDGSERVESTLTERGGRLFARAEITSGGKSASGAAESAGKERLNETNAIKKSVFYAGKKLSDMPAPWGISTGIRPAKNARRMLESGKSESEVLSVLETEYLVEEKKARLAIEVAKKEAELLKDRFKNSVSIYVGIPFCPSRCSYCSFISRAADYNNKFIAPYAEALLREIEYTAKIISSLSQTVETVYFGGGTPTAIPTHLLERIIEKLYECFDLSNVREFTVEAGRPDTFTKEAMDMLKRHGVGRVCVNPQTMRRETLDKIGRKHSVSDVERAFYLAREAGIESVNSDLIAGLPGEDEKIMRETLSALLALRPDAVTVHTLYLKRAAFMAENFNEIRFAKDTASMVDAAAETLNAEGFFPYYLYKQRNTLGNLENVGFAKKGHESLYNVYIMEEVEPVAALGAGAATKMVKGDAIKRVFNPKDASDYVSRIDEVLRRKDEYLRFYV